MKWFTLQTRHDDDWIDLRSYKTRYSAEKADKRFHENMENQISNIQTRIIIENE